MSRNAGERCRQPTGISRRPWKPASGTCEASGHPAAGPMSGPAARCRSTCSTRQDRRRGPGHPGIGPFGAKQLQSGRLKQGQTPGAGVVEVKPARGGAWLTAGSGRVTTARATPQSRRPSGWPGPQPASSHSGRRERREHGDDRPDRADLPGRARAAGVGR